MKSLEEGEYAQKASIIHHSGISDQLIVSKALWTASGRGLHDARLKTITDDYLATRCHGNKHDRSSDTLDKPFDASFHSAAHSDR